MKLISWNVNGIRACLKKGFEDFYEEIDADIFCLQETKMQIINNTDKSNISANLNEQIQLDKKTNQEIDEIINKPIFERYYSYWNSAEKKGYSGTAIFSKIKPINVFYGIGIEEHDKEGRVITLEFGDFYIVNVYTPNSKRELERLAYRQVWEDELRKYLLNLNKTKPVIMCGDLNVAHNEIDLKNPKSNRGNAGFTDEERTKMTELLNAGFIDSFRYLYPNKEECYSWWSYMGKAREKNIGWRIDYFIVSKDIKNKIKEAKIHSNIFGSDHCPVELDIESF